MLGLELRIVLSVEAIVSSFVCGQGTLLDFHGFAASSTRDSRVGLVDKHVLTRVSGENVKRTCSSYCVSFGPYLH